VRQLDLEEQKRARWKAENVRRKHNYVPFIINLLRQVSE
jgi:ubiquitin carboxyl-terminal hydrolase L5